MSNEADKSASSLQKLDVRNSDEMPALWNCTLSGCMTWEKIVLVERMYRAKSALDGAEALQRAYSQLDEITTDLDNSGLSQQLSLFNNSLHELSAQPADRALREFAVLQGETLASNIRRTRDSVLEDSDYLAISAGGIGADTEVVNQLVDLVDTPLDTLDGRIVRETYEDTVESLGQQISLQQNATIGLKDFHATLKSQHLAITGVNIDEESIRMIAYQRSFQASSRVIAAASEMLELLVAI